MEFDLIKKIPRSLEIIFR